MRPGWTRVSIPNSTGNFDVNVQGDSVRGVSRERWSVMPDGLIAAHEMHSALLEALQHRCLGDHRPDRHAVSRNHGQSVWREQSFDELPGSSVCATMMSHLEE